MIEILSSDQSAISLDKQELLLHRMTASPIQALTYRVEKGWSIKPRRLGNDFLFIPIEGEIKFGVNRRFYHVKKGEAMAVPEGELQEAELLSKELRVIAVHGHWKIDGLISIFRWWNSFHLSNFSSNLFQKISHIASVGEDICRHPLTLERWMVDLTLEQMESQNLELPPAIQLDSRVRLALGLLDREYADASFTVSSLGERVGLSAVRLRELFRQQVGESPRTRLGRLRMMMAQHLLESTNWTVSRVGVSVGITSDALFYRMFRSHCGTTPSAFRRQKQMIP